MGGRVRTPREACLAGALAGCLLAPGSTRPAAGEAATLAVEVEVAVALRHVRVLDERACIAARVDPGDLLLVVDGEPLPTRLRRPKGPIRVLLLVDGSFSMVGRRLDLAVLAARQLLERLARERRGDEVAIGVFDERTYWLTPGFTSDLCDAAALLAGLDVDRATALWQAFEAGLDLIETEPSARPTVIFMATDGQDTEDRDGSLAEHVRRRARRLDVPIFTVAIPPLGDTLIADGDAPGPDLVHCRQPDWVPRWLDAQRKRLLEVCADSGGAMYTPRQVRVREAVGFIASQLRDVLEVEAELPGRLSGREVRVSTTRRGLSVLAGRDRPARGR